MPRIDDPSQLPAALRARRAELQLSQEQVAEVTGLNRRVIGELKRGTISPRFATVLAIASALGLDLELRARER